MKAIVFTIGEKRTETFPAKAAKGDRPAEPAKDVFKRSLMLNVATEAEPNYLKVTLWADEAEMSDHLTEGQVINITFKKDSVKIVG